MIRNFHLDVSVAFTNKVPTSPVRGAGRPEAAVVMERLMDRVARELKLDRAEVRRRNFITPEQMPYKVGIIFRDGRPVTYDSGDYPVCQRDALAAVDYEGFRARQAKAREEGRYVGLGIGNAVEATGLGPYESATVRVSTSGKLTRLYRRDAAGPVAQDHAGADRRRSFRLHARRHHDRDCGHRRDRTRRRLVCGAHRGQCRLRRCIWPPPQVAQKIKQFAAQMMEVAEQDVVLENGYAKVAGSDVKRSFREVAARRGRHAGLLHGGRAVARA